MLMMPFVGINLPSSTDIALISDMGLDALYHAHRVSVLSAPTCTVTLTILGDGTWTVTKDAAATWTAGSTFSGSWAAETTNGADYEVSFNNGSSWQSLSSNRTATATANDTTVNNGSVIVNNSNTVIVRKTGTTSPTSSDAFALRAEDEYSTV